MAYINQECPNVKKIAIVFATPYNICLENNNSRERVVPEEVLSRMISNFEMPSYAEGFDEIKIIQNCLIFLLKYINIVIVDNL